MSESRSEGEESFFFHETFMKCPLAGIAGKVLVRTGSRGDRRPPRQKTGRLSHDLDLLQCADLVPGKPKLGEYLIGLLAELRRSGYNLAWRARQRDRLADQADVARFRVGDVLGDAEMLNLGVREHLVDRIDRAAGDPSGVEFLDPGLSGFLLGELVDLGIKRVAVLRARRTRDVVGVGNPFGCAGG